MPIQIAFNDQVITKAESSVTILKQLELHNLMIESQCRDGFCGVCRCKLEQGEVNYVKQPLAYIAEDEVLPCCAVAITDVTISR